MKTIFMLEDGTVFPGKSSGQIQETAGKVVVNTSVVGYQEMLTDPANAGKIILLTYPLIGNYGIADKFSESGRVWAKGLLIREQSAVYSNWQAEIGLEEYSVKTGVAVVSDIDTRAAALHIRSKGEMIGIIARDNCSAKELSSRIAAYKSSPGINKEIPAQTEYITPAKGKLRIVLLDMGVTRSFLRQVEMLGARVFILPYNCTAQDILNNKPAALIISGGPEEHPGFAQVTETVRSLLGKVPVLGVGTGCQVLGCACGGEREKMKYGHHGSNYPVYRPGSYRAEITVQNHSFALRADSFSKLKNVKVSGYNLNDRSVEEIVSKKLLFIGVQYYSVAQSAECPGDPLVRLLKMTGTGN